MRTPTVRFGLIEFVNGEDAGGITKAVNWEGGSGYHFYELAPSLLIKNERLPIYQINPEYTFDMLCEAICKIEASNTSRMVYITDIRLKTVSSTSRKNL